MKCKLKIPGCLMKTTLLVLCVFLSFFSIAQPVSKKLVDRETGSSVPFANVSFVGNNGGIMADEDGVFTVSAKVGQRYRITQVGYCTIELSYEQLMEPKEILMDEVNIEINPVIVSADAARRDILRAIDSTYKLLKAPLFLTCYQQDRVEVNNQMVVEAKAIIAAKIITILSPSKGNSGSYKLEGLSVAHSPNFPVDTVSTFRFLPGVYVNSFLVGASKKDDSNLVYSYLNVNDSIIVISFRPKKSFIPSGHSILTSGRFFIDKKSWRMLRIDTELSNSMLSYMRESVANRKKAKEYYLDYSTSTTYSNLGIPVTAKRLMAYSLKGDSTNARWVCTSYQVFSNSREQPKTTSEKKKLNKYKALIFQTASTTPEFEFQFIKGFKAE
ncbi:hypothetical protein SAMN05216323_109413 [Williamwhitmania taraxaci]|uniref:CarboxypepD_reg-like domain-containing protein n=2 Tax=Williamwhitmania taraxaci TaxID=1640674 RepID=A0A1G6SGX1_9BACT|nr:hypothetical protein SAMN05216323_109413 [Williamwhitmania taraxaci]